jgi:hypothetical protein
MKLMAFKTIGITGIKAASTETGKNKSTNIKTVIFKTTIAKTTIVQATNIITDDIKVANSQIVCLIYVKVIDI